MLPDAASNTTKLCSAVQLPVSRSKHGSRFVESHTGKSESGAFGSSRKNVLTRRNNFGQSADVWFRLLSGGILNPASVTSLAQTLGLPGPATAAACNAIAAPWSNF